MASVGAFIDNIPMYLNYTEKAVARLQSQFDYSGRLNENIKKKTIDKYTSLKILNGWIFN